MTAEQIILIKRSWRIFKQVNPHLVGGVFYEKLFSGHPQLRKLFRNSMETQSQKLIDMLTFIVLHLHDMDKLEESLSNLAVRHVHYGVKPEYYAAVGTAFLWTLRQGLGTEWNTETEEAWKSCYKKLSDTMIGSLSRT